MRTNYLRMRFLVCPIIYISLSLAFMQHIHPLCPNNFVVSGLSFVVFFFCLHHLAKEAGSMWEELLQVSTGSLTYPRIEQWVNGFVYSVVFCNGIYPWHPIVNFQKGCRTLSYEKEADTFARAAESIMQYLFFSKDKFDPVFVRTVHDLTF